MRELKTPKNGAESAGTDVRGKIVHASPVTQQEAPAIPATQPAMRSAHAIEERIARLVIHFHYTDEDEDRRLLFAQMAALHWAVDPETDWCDIHDAVDGYVDAVLREERLDD